MSKAIVAIVGRPNVGKSTFFNYIAGKRISIVEDKPGVTRDRIYSDAEWLGREFTMIDTGGIEPDSEDIILSQMRNQAQIAIDTADVIVFMVDGSNPITTADEEIGMMLRRAKKEVILVANKIDNINSLPDNYYDFYNLGLGEPFPISSKNALNLGDLLDMIIWKFPETEAVEEEDDNIKVALIGKPNVGKSSLINTILGEERVIVSNIAGTTRDAIDSPVEIDGQKYVFIDTAGIRRKGKVNENVEKYSVLRSLTAIDRSDVCVIVIDAVQGVTEQDKRVAGYAHEAGKAILIVVNKWDLIKKDSHTYSAYEKDVRAELAYLQYAPVLFVSALTKQRLGNILEQIKYVSNNNSLRVSTGLLNDVLNEAIMLNQPPSDKGRRLKIFYGTQVGVKPPTFVLFVNDVELSHFSYIRYLENKLRDTFNFEGTPIRIHVRNKKKKDFIK
ncbi:MAG: ribosome biogenesis GTPase Der [Firmicutes bacterium]|jgi:GTP-binding protein|nr:ribosome biogenesis GTPase Der [Bacillota bacterium]